MSTSKEFVDFVLGQFEDSDNVRARAMMGEYVLYYREKVIGGLYDSRLLVKAVPAALELFEEPILESPYTGAKEMLLIENPENGEFLRRLFEAMYDQLPAPKKKTGKTAASKKKTKTNAASCVRLRRYRKSDLDEILDLFYQTVHSTSFYSHKQLDAWAPQDPDKEAWAKSLEDHYTLVATKNGTIVGFGDLAENGLLDRLYVLKEFQKQGIGKKLVDRLEKQAKTQSNILSVYASVPALDFFTHCGFYVADKHIATRRGVDLQNYFMQKELSDHEKQ